MKIIRSYGNEPTDFVEFADKHNLDLKMGIDVSGNFYCSFVNAEYKDGVVLVSSSGRGETEEEAIKNYAKEISRKLLVIDAYTSSRREIQVPVLSYNP